MIGSLPTLILLRDHPDDIAHRLAIMSIDGREVAKMNYKDRVAVDVAAGKHTLEGKNELGRRSEIEFEIEEGETLSVHIGGLPIGCFSIYAGLLPPIPHIVMQVGEPWQRAGGSNWRD